MKRKRGHKKGKSKGSKAARVSEGSKPVPTQDVEENSGMDDAVNDEHDSGMEVNTPSSSGTDQPSNVANINPDGSIDRTSAKPVGRVKVKLKTTKALESQHTSSDTPSQSDTDKSNQKMDLEKQATVAEKMEDSISSLPETKVVRSENPSKKAGSIKIKTARALVSSNNQSTSSVGAEGQSEHQKEAKATLQTTRYSKQELESALMVIKKVMKMDAAEPFNVPVDPVALGIPDYFDVIDTPMDFGTICSNIEKGVKYLNSEDVFKDVQFIWGNCYKYNNKGDYILDLMRRVKKNFMKYWTAAGLYSGNDNNQGENAQGKGGSKQKAKKRQGMRRHKNDCLCAICVLKRKRKEREERERIARGQTAEDLKQEDTSLIESPYGDDSSSNSDNSQDQYPDADMEEKAEGVNMEISQQQHSPRDKKMEDAEDGREGEDEIEAQKNDEGPTLEKLQYADGLEGEPNRQKVKTMELSGGFQENIQKENAVEQHRGPQQDLKETQERQRKAQLHEHFHRANPALLSLCGILFPENTSSTWSGPHSLVPNRPATRPNPIRAAIESFMK